jgi:phospholipid/cholesterol/gamma-HCH transport system ATP-binding protein
MASVRPEIVVEGLHKSFGGKPVLQGVDVTVENGEMVAIVGGSGCGKTVLLKLVMAHYPPDSGRVRVADHESPTGPGGAAPLVDMATLDEAGLDRIRTHWAVVFQRNALVTGDVFHNLAVLPREVKGMSDEAIMPLARKALSDVGLDPDAVMHRDREELSGGMAKRVAIARAIVMDPVIVMYDEPTAGLDPEMSAQIHALIGATHRAQPAFAAGRVGAARTSVIVTHDTELLRRLRPRVVMLHAGRVLFDGSFDAFAASDDPHILPYRAQMGTLHEDGGHDLAPTGGEPRTGPTAGHPG